jgi:RNA polymerase sigma factor (sigma-70 family)
VNDQTDSQLLRAYAETRSEPAFAELVRRHVDHVFSAAVRMVCDSHLAEDVTQGAFVALAKSAAQLRDRPVLSGWLHRTAQNIAAQTVRTDVRRRAREQEAADMNELLSAESDDATWEQIAPHLDGALGELSELERDAVMLRYFEKKSAQEMAQALGTSEAAAQKRVSRAVERLRELIAKRGATVGAGGLVVVISGNAVHAAPVGLAAAISTAATLAGSSVAVTATAATTTKVIAMTTLQKALISAVVIVAAGAGIYQARQASHLREQVETLRQQQSPVAERIQHLQQERDEVAGRLAALQEENAQLKQGQKLAELMKLRGEVGVLRQSLSSATASNAPAMGIAKLMNDPAMKEYIRQVQLRTVKERYAPLFKELKLTPEETERFTQAVGEIWMRGSELASNSDQTEARKTLEATDKEVESELKALLGDARYERYKQFDQEVPAHTTVKLLDDHLGNNRLSEEQNGRLFAVVRAEPYTATHGLAGELDLAFFGSQQEIDKHLQQVEESNARILQKAGDFLTPDQVAALANLQSNSVVAQKVQGQALTQKH